MSLKVLHIGQMIGGLDVYIRNSITYSNELIEYAIAHGKKDMSAPVIRRGEQVKEYEISLQRAIGIGDFTAFLEVIRILREEKPDIIHCHSAKGGVIGRIASLCTGIPVAYTPHAFSFLSSANVLKKNAYKFIEQFSKGKAFVLACSPSEREIAINKIGYRPEKALLWSNAVPDCKDLWEDPAQTDETCGGDFICYIGRPSYQKNMELLVETARLIHKKQPDIKILLLGVGHYSPDLEKLKKSITASGLDDVFLLKPWLTHAQCLGWVKNSLFYLTTSRYEGLPLSVIEAMSLSKAIVGTKVVGNIDCIYHGVNGFLADNATGLSECCVTLIENANLRRRFETNSRQIFEEQFDIKRRIHNLEDCYRHIIKYEKQDGK